jgi:WD40 repeat protein
VLSLASAPEGRFLAAGYEPVPRRPEDVDNLILWDVPRQQIDRTFPVPRRVHTLATTQDSRTLVLGTAWRPGVSVWDLPARPSRLEGVGMERLRLGERHERPRVLALGPDDRTIAAGHPDGTIRLWDLHTGRPLRTLQGHQRDVQALAFQPGGRLLASGGRDGSVRLWSVDTGEQVHLLPGKLGEARCLAFSPDGLTLVSGHGGIAQLWDVKTGVPRSTMRAHKFAITSLVFLDQGRLLATAGWDRTVKLWKLQPGTAGAL